MQETQKAAEAKYVNSVYFSLFSAYKNERTWLDKGSVASALTFQQQTNHVVLAEISVIHKGVPKGNVIPAVHLQVGFLFLVTRI